MYSIATKVLYPAACKPVQIPPGPAKQSICVKTRLLIDLISRFAFKTYFLNYKDSYILFNNVYLFTELWKTFHICRKIGRMARANTPKKQQKQVNFSFIVKRYSLTTTIAVSLHLKHLTSSLFQGRKLPQKLSCNLIYTPIIMAYLPYFLLFCTIFR